VTGRERPFAWLLWAAAGSVAVLLFVALLGADAAIMAAIHGPGEQPSGPGWLTKAALDLTSLGSLAVWSLAVAAAALLEAARGRLRLALLMGVSAAMGEGASEIVKQVVHRPRPPTAAALQTFGLSFPSGHAMMAAVAYLTLGAVAARAERSTASRRLLIALALALVGLIGVTRVYLGAHWPSDVLAGWTLGALWAWLTATLAARLTRADRAEAAE
jgi:undecaprenyl-diphosphatase